MIGYIKFENEIKIGDIELDFFKNKNEVYNTIVLAGENGCGKTTILNAIAAFQRGSYLHESSSVQKVMYLDENGKVHEILREKESLRYSKPGGITQEEWEDANEFTEQDFYAEKMKLSNEKPYDIRNRKVIFSEARSGFEVKLEGNNSKYDYEEDKYEKKGANYSGIVQLLIDLEEKDNYEFIKYAKLNPTCTYEEYMKKNSRILRFKKAYESMFEELVYVGEKPEIDYRTIWFLKGEQLIDINELSTGEQQIVFRGADLLYQATNGATIIIDEPELSLHPKWQKKILKFYRNLFTNEYGKQIAQLIIATHSQYIVQEAMKDSDNVKVILLKKEGIETKANVIDKAVLGMYSSAEINYLAFGVEKKDYHIQLFSALHNKLQNIPENEVNAHIASIDCYIKNHRLYDTVRHEKEDTSHNHYYTLPVFIRNAIDHPDSGRRFSDNDLDVSIALLRDIYKEVAERR